MAKRRKRMSADFDDLIEELFDNPLKTIDKGLESMDKNLSREMRNLDQKLSEMGRRIKDVKKHKMSFKDKKGNNVRVEFDDDGNGIHIQTNGNLDIDLMKEIEKRIKNDRTVPPPPKPTPPPMRNDSPSHNGVLFWTRTWRGGRGKPMVVTTDSRVVVSVGGIFGRKYTVEVDGVVVYMVKHEELIKRYVEREMVEVLTHKWNEGEITVMRKILDSLDKLGISESHHQKLYDYLGSV